MSEVRLSPMGEEDFQRFKEAYVKEIADESVGAGVWSAEEAQEKPRQVLKERLPQGMATADNFFFVIIDSLSGQPVGHVWLGVERGAQGPVGQLLDLCLEKKYRGRGFGTATLKALDAEAAKLGLKAIRLYVLSNKAVAVHLYETSGYWPRTYEMVKEYPAKP